MIDKSDVSYNIKTGSDTDLYLARVNTEKKVGGQPNPKFGKIKTHAGGRDFPYLTRTTGNSLKPTTEFIQSNELRHGGAESAPRPGNTSVDGSIDIELSPVTFDDNICSLFNNEWRAWESDNGNAEVNFDNIPCGNRTFLTRASKLNNPLDPSKGYDEETYNSDEALKPRKLINDGVAANADGILVVPKGCVVNEMVFGKKSIEYMVTKKYGGAEGEDMYHIFNRLAAGSMDLSAQIGQIVTGSFNFMGDSSSNILETAEAKTYLGGSGVTKFEDGVTTGNDFIDKLPLKSTDTDQFTTREGDMWINGKKITFAQTLTFNVDKNMDRKYALFVKNAVAKSSLKKAITANIETYLVPEAKELYNLANNHKTFELMFAFEDKETNPEYIYLVQIFSAKAEDKDLNASGEADYTMSVPLRSFGERLCRVLKVALPKVLSAKSVSVSSVKKAVFTPNAVLTFGDLVPYDASANPDGIKVTVKVTVGDTTTEETFSPVIGYEVPDGNSKKIVNADRTTPVSGANIILDLVETSATYGQIIVAPTVTAGTTDKSVEVNFSWNGKDVSCFYTVAHS